MRSIRLFLFTLGSCCALADGVPPLINYQGRLTDASGAALADGNYRVAFNLWNNSTASSTNAPSHLVWAREYDVALMRGAFNVILGADGGKTIEGSAVHDLSFAFTEKDRYLGLTILATPTGLVASPREILPRQQLLSTPYALRASVADSLVQQLAEALNPAGTIVAFAGATDTVPPGWLLCDGRPVSRTGTTERLFNVLKTAWGSGDGSSTFNLPDFRGRVAMGSGQGVGLSNRSIGQKLGEETHKLTIAEMPSHDHQLATLPLDHAAPGGYSGGGWFGDPRPQNTSKTGGDSPHNIVQPSLVVNYIIKY